ncbi:MAG: M1 family metallopeptidase [Planctomycetes bacterium]|nr:M1 family metallopeptidase [Planctomycetota bacterium]
MKNCQKNSIKLILAVSCLILLPTLPVQAQSDTNEDTDVTHCALDIDLDFEAKTISGVSSITATSLRDDLSTFTIDLRDNMIVDEVLLGGTSADYGRPGHEIVVKLNKKYQKGESFTVSVEYHGQPKSIGFGSFRWSQHEEEPIVSSFSCPWNAHTWWPCKEHKTTDDLQDKFTMDMWITVPDDKIAVANGVLSGEENIADERKRYYWKESYPIMTYLVAFAATNYAQFTLEYEHDDGVMPVVIYCYPERLDYAKERTGNLVEQIAVLSEYYGEYPFVKEKYGIAQFQGGASMEHQTMTFQSGFSSGLNVHELAHQWWGDMITCETWGDMWLNEGFATFTEALYVEKKPGGTQEDYIKTMRRKKPRNLSGSVYVTNTSSQGAVYSTTNVYNKGAWIVHMLRGVLGDETFFATLKAYRAKYEYQTATTADLKEIAEDVSGEDLDWFFDEWIFGSGVPSYKFGWKDIIVDDNHQVLLHIDQHQTEYQKFKMPIEITVTTGTGSKIHTVWHQGDTQWYVLGADGPVTQVQLDKNDWILKDTVAEEPYRIRK